MNQNSTNNGDEDLIINIDNDDRINRRSRKRLNEASFLELVAEICRRLWFSLRRCFRTIFHCCVYQRVPSTTSSESGSDDQCLLDSPQQQEITRLKNDITNYETRLSELTVECETLKYEHGQLQQRFIQDRQSLLNEIDNLNLKLGKARSDMEEMRKSKDDALSRLSEMMGVKLRDNNPAITDLNDPNRPMKLGEQFNELYENDWTEAFLDLQDTKCEDNNDETLNEEETILILLNILREVNKESIGQSKSQLSGMLESVQDLSKDDTSDFIKSVKDSHKSNAARFVPLLYKKITGENSVCKTVARYIDHCQQYIENCVKICYFAAVQDPPMYLDFEPDETYDKQIFKEYTAMGSKVRFLVWPALFLHKGGALLSKGVVQPIEDTD